MTPAAPARVTALQADNDHTTHSLTVSWERPAGAYDGYSLQLLDEAGAVLANRSVSAQSRSERLEGLISGRWYRVKVVTLSGGIPSAEATAEGQTRESRIEDASGDATPPGSHTGRSFYQFPDSGSEVRTEYRVFQVKHR